MTELVVYDSDRFDLREKVANMRMQGLTDTQVGKRLNIQRKTVLELYDEYKMLLAQDSESIDRAVDLLNTMIVQYDKLISDHWSLVEKIRAEAFNEKWAGAENKALATIADLIAKRLDAVQKAGLLENSELGDELADMEEKATILINILRDDLCDDCKKHVARKLESVTRTVEVVREYDD